ncbi:MAG TPA: hypothetical protein VMH81_38010 [Bryobacteraceae bacterium]|nr:hypothetical protein [Bryobacteraceae bacterium]
MGKLLVGFVTGVAGQPRMSALRQFLPLVMTGRAFRRGRLLCGMQIGAGCPDE